MKIIARFFALWLGSCLLFGCKEQVRPHASVEITCRQDSGKAALYQFDIKADDQSTVLLCMLCRPDEKSSAAEILALQTMSLGEFKHRCETGMIHCLYWLNEEQRRQQCSVDFLGVQPVYTFANADIATYQTNDLSPGSLPYVDLTKSLWSCAPDMAYSLSPENTAMLVCKFDQKVIWCVASVIQKD